MEPLRIGILGAARISALALIHPAQQTGARLVAVAARSRDRAQDFAERHDVDQVLDTYQDVIDHPEVEVVYNPLANSLHAPWNARVLAAGKHVFTEKPSAANADEAQRISEQVGGSSTGQQFFEGFHYYYHPNIHRLHEIILSGEIGDLQHVETVMDMQAPAADDPRWSLELAGGALMDLGCYSLHSLRMLRGVNGGEPVITAVDGGERGGSPGVDAWVSATLEYPNGVTGAASCNMQAADHRMSHRVVGTRGQAEIVDFVNPHIDDRLIVTTADGARVEQPGDDSSYTYQLRALTTAIRTGTPASTDAVDAVKTMAMIDHCYRALGLPLRQSQV